MYEYFGIPLDSKHESEIVFADLGDGKRYYFDVGDAWTDAAKMLYQSGQCLIPEHPDSGVQNVLWEKQSNEGEPEFRNIDGKKYELIKECRKDKKECRCLLYTSPSPRDATLSRMPSSA